MENKCDAECEQYEIKAQHTISIDRHKKKLKGEKLDAGQGGLSELSQLRSDGSQDSKAGSWTT